jgi:hypothetical protein
MAGKDNKFIKALRPGSLEKGEIFAEVGRAIVNLSDIENWISSIYHEYCNPLSTSQSMPVFYEQAGFDRKLKLADLIVRLKAEKKHKEKWIKIIAGLDEHRLIRNLIAHYGIVVDTFTKDRPQAYLQPPWLKLNKSGKHTGKILQLAEIRATASALERIKGELGDFWRELQDYWYPQEDDEVEEDDS